MVLVTLVTLLVTRFSACCNNSIPNRLRHPCRMHTGSRDRFCKQRSPPLACPGCGSWVCCSSCLGSTRTDGMLHMRDQMASFPLTGDAGFGRSLERTNGHQPGWATSNRKSPLTRKRSHLPSLPLSRQLQYDERLHLELVVDH